MIIVGIAISLLLHSIVPFPEHDHNRLYDFLISIIITVLVWEGNLRIDTVLNEKYPWVIKPGKRILIQLFTGLFFSVFAIYLPMLLFNGYVCTLPQANKGELMGSSVVIGILITVIILSIEISTQFFNNWKNSLIEVEKHKTEATQALLQNLKNQVNPHFLFNNLSVLSSLVYIDQDKAVDFINQLSKVYRYLLDNKTSELVSLDTELTFIKSYTYLIQIRFDKNIIFDFNIADNCLNLLMPPMSLQMLIENTIKHNEVSSELPLTVSIVAKNNELKVTNNLQLRTNREPSSKTGLQNIKDRYKFYSEKEVEIIHTEKTFVVILPLLNSK